MTAEEFEAWFLSQPGLIAYLLLLGLGSLVSFVILAWRLPRMQRLPSAPVSPWSLPPLDFGLFLVALVLWFVASGAILMELFSWLAAPESEPGAGTMVAGGLFLQSGMLYLFMRFRSHHRNPMEGPLSPRILSLTESLRLGLFYFLASLPVIYGVGAVWNGFLEILRRQGFELDLPLQDAVLLFQETNHPLALGGLFLLAVVVAPVVEECVFRGGIYRFLKGHIPLPAALLISGFLFGLIHGNLQSLPGLVAVGVCLGIAYELSGNLKVPIFFHACFNLNSVIWILALPEVS